MKRIFFLALFVFVFGFLFVEKSSAQYCDCILIDKDSDCGSNFEYVCVEQSFITSVVNAQPAANDFSTGSSSGSYVEVSNNLFKIIGVNRTYLKSDILFYGNVNLQANKSINYKNIRVFGDPWKVELNAEKIEGGLIQNAVDWLKDESGKSGKIFIRGTSIQTSSINTAGIGNNGGDITIYGESITVGNISTASEEGGFSTTVYGNAGKITIQRDENNPKIVALLVNGDIRIHGAKPAYISIKAEERILIKGRITTYSGCADLSATEVTNGICDYGTLCSTYPSIYPSRKFCKTYNSSGKVILKADGQGEDKGIRVDIGIDNSAYSGHSESNMPWIYNENGIPIEKVTGAGKCGEVVLEASTGAGQAGGLVYIGANGIKSIGFHPESAVAGQYAVNITGNWVYVGGEIKTDNYKVKAWPEELIVGGVENSTGTGAGNINITASGPQIDRSLPDPDDNSKLLYVKKNPWVKFNAPIFAQGKYAFASNGGNISISSDFRIESDYEDWGVKTLKIDASGFSLTSGNKQESEWNPLWYVVDGISADSSSNPIITPYINSEENFCGYNISKNEYYDGVDAGYNVAGSRIAPADSYSGEVYTSPTGGSGGNIIISAPVVQWFREDAPGGGKKSNKLQLISNGGNGARGGKGGVGDYCPFLNPDTGYTGERHNIIPKTGKGSHGGKGGDGGTITVTADDLHCFTKMEFNSSGGEGGAGGVNNGGEQKSVSSYNDYTGNCDLQRWGSGSAIVPEEEPPRLAGAGGAGGTAVFSSPTDLASRGVNVGLASADLHGGNAGISGRGVTIAYPWYCTSFKTGAELIVAYESVQNCIKVAQDSGAYYCEDDYGTSNWKYQACIARKVAECIYVGDTDENKDRIYGDPMCCQNYQGRINGWCYSESIFNSTCRPKVVQIPCQTEGFTADETKSSWDISKYFELGSGWESFLEIIQARTSYNGQDGASGGRGGNLIIEKSAIVLENPEDFSIINLNGGNGGAGSEAQNSSIGAGGNGGAGGKGGNSGTIKITNSSLVSNYRNKVNTLVTENGFRGEGGTGGQSGENSGSKLPQADHFCAGLSGEDSPYWDYALSLPYYDNSNQKCPAGSVINRFVSGKYECCRSISSNYNCCTDESQYCCSIPEELTSCRTRAEGSNNYSVSDYSVNFSAQGTQGSVGTLGDSGSSNSTSSQKPAGPEKCIEREKNDIEGEEIDITAWLAGWIEDEKTVPPATEEESGGCCNTVDDDLDGFLDCEDPDCEDDCYNNLTPYGYLIKGGAMSELLPPDYQETWNKECGVVICDDGKDNDNDGGRDMGDDTYCTACGDGEQHPGEECNEPGLSCAEGQTCVNCRCQEDTCETDDDCSPGETCEEGECVPSEEENSLPTASGLNAAVHDETCFEPPSVELSWTYSDPEGDAQGYRIQISDDEFFNNIVVDSGAQIPSSQIQPTKYTATQLSYSTDTDSDGYWWRIKVWDDQHTESDAEWKDASP